MKKQTFFRLIGFVAFLSLSVFICLSGCNQNNAPERKYSDVEIIYKLQKVQINDLVIFKGKLYKVIDLIEHGDNIEDWEIIIRNPFNPAFLTSNTVNLRLKLIAPLITDVYYEDTPEYKKAAEKILKAL